MKQCEGYRKKCKKWIKKGKLCSGCYHRKRKFEAPLKYTFFAKRCNAKTQVSDKFPQGVPFELSYNDWEKFWIEDYPQAWEIKKQDLFKGIKPHKHKISIDRKNPAKGYCKGNIQPMTVSDNSRKKDGEWIVDRIKYAFNPDPFTEVPF